MSEPKHLTDPESRERARWVRDNQWAFADLAAEYGTIWFCWWDKVHRHRNRERRTVDLWVEGLIGGMEILDWLKRHEDWWIIGEWDDARYAAPVTITDAGRAALAEREKYDMEPVYGGMVEPGWQCIPAEPHPTEASEVRK